MRRLVAVLAAVVVVVAMAGCEPKATISATPSTTEAFCEQGFSVAGTVTPHNATPKVVLQRTYGGKWKDVPNSGQLEITQPTSVDQSTGRYKINVTFVLYWSEAMHLRVRSNSGESVSGAFYLPINPNESC